MLTGYEFLRGEYTEYYNKFRLHCQQTGIGQDYDHRFNVWLQRKDYV